MKPEVNFEVVNSAKVKNRVFVKDGTDLVIAAELRSYDDYVDEVVNGGNECAVKFGVFTDLKGKQYIYWGDDETFADYLTEVK